MGHSLRDLVLPAPSGSSDDAAEIAAGEVRILIREHVGLDVAEGRLRLVLDAVVEGLDDVFVRLSIILSIVRGQWPGNPGHCLCSPVLLGSILLASGRHRSPRPPAGDPAGTAAPDKGCVIELASLSWRGAHASHLASRDATACYQGRRRRRRHCCKGRDHPPLALH